MHTRRLSVVLLTHNEEANLPACLKGLEGLDCEIFIVDSGSTDRTLEIAEQYGATIFQHLFKTHARQWSWALQNLPIATEWILALDADQHLTPELRDEISNLPLDTEPGTDAEPVAYFIKRKQIFRGKWIRYGGYYPKYLLKLFRRSEVWVDERDLVDHHFRVHGKVAKLRYPILEDNRKELDIHVWIDKHNRYAVLQAREEIDRFANLSQRVLAGSCFGNPDERVLWRKRIWNGLPLYLRPALYFLYRYVVRLGFLDGKEGFIFHFLQAFWYRLLVDINRDDMRRVKN